MNLTTTQIRVRLEEIAKLQTEIEVRDFEAELKATIKSGGDIDALEEQQLQAERNARRLRAEAKALQEMLPEIERTEALAELAALAESMEGQKDRFLAAALEIGKLKNKIREYEVITMSINREREKAYVRAKQLLGKYKPEINSEVMKRDIEPFEMLAAHCIDDAAPLHPDDPRINGPVYLDHGFFSSKVFVD